MCVCVCVCVYLCALARLCVRAGLVTLGATRPGAQLIERVLRLAEAYEGATISEVYLHVQSNNEEALRFYDRFGFSRGDLVPAYYKHIEPSDAYVVRKVLRGS